MYSETPVTVSVIIPAYNAAKYIGEALRSVSNQTFTSHEVIIINDGSPDTEELETQLKDYPANLTYLKQENRGAAAARNTGLRAASGEFVGFLDADDMWLPNFLETQIQFLKKSQADIVYADALSFGESPLAGRTFMEVQPSRGEVTPENLLAGEVTVITSTVLVRRAAVVEVGLFDETIRRGHDFDLWFRLAKRGFRFTYHDQVLAHRRIMDTSLSGNEISQLERTVSVFDAIKRRGDLTASENEAVSINTNRALARLAIERGKEKLSGKDFAAAAMHFEEARRFEKSWKLIAVLALLRFAPKLLWRMYEKGPKSAAVRSRS